MVFATSLASSPRALDRGAGAGAGSQEGVLAVSDGQGAGEGGEELRAPDGSIVDRAQIAMWALLFGKLVVSLDYGDVFFFFFDTCYSCSSNKEPFIYFLNFFPSPFTRRLRRRARLAQPC